MIIFASFNYVALLYSTLANVSMSPSQWWGTMAAMVDGSRHGSLCVCVFAVYKHVWCLLCYKCTDSYRKKGGQLKLRKFSFLWLVDWLIHVTPMSMFGDWCNCCRRRDILWVSNEASELLVKVLAPWHYNKTPTPNKRCDTFERQQPPSRSCPAELSHSPSPSRPLPRCPSLSRQLPLLPWFHWHCIPITMSVAEPSRCLQDIYFIAVAVAYYLLKVI